MAPAQSIGSVTQPAIETNAEFYHIVTRNAERIWTGLPDGRGSERRHAEDSEALNGFRSVKQAFNYVRFACTF